MTFIYILMLVIPAIAILYVYMTLETRWLKVERLDFSSDGKGLRIMHITDLHINMTRITAKKIKEVVDTEKPDVILVTGDYIDKPIHAADFLKYLHTFSKGYRTIICLGNHDIKAFKTNNAGLENFISEIEALQVEVLRNKTAIIEKSRKKYNIIGVDDLRAGNPDIEKAMIGCIPEAPKILITHNPDLALSIPGKIVDYMFAGHFHGGQIWMPFNLEFLILRDDQLCKMGLCKGLKRINDIKVYMNRGLGNGVVPLRFLSRPEILICTIP